MKSLLITEALRSTAYTAIIERATRIHLARRFNAREDKKIYMARTAAEHISLNCAPTREIVIQIYNLRNPNGITVTYWPKDQTHKAERFVNAAWIKRQVAAERAATKF